MLRFILTRLRSSPNLRRHDPARLHDDPAGAGRPIETLAGNRASIQPPHAALVKEYGLDQPLLTQYVCIGRVLRGDLGKSMITQAPVLQEFGALPATIELALCAILFALLLGVRPAACWRR